LSIPTFAKFADEGEMRRAVDMLNEIVAGVEGVTVAVHLCRRNWGRRGWGAAGGYEAILAHIQRLRVPQLMMEFSVPVAGDMAVLKELPENVRIGLGCVDVRFPEIDSPETIVERLREQPCARPGPSRSSTTASPPQRPRNPVGRGVREAQERSAGAPRCGDARRTSRGIQPVGERGVSGGGTC
jgi:hypothetical protein